jgi:mRNA export factor
VVESPLKYSTSALQTFPDGKGFCIGSIEGRTSVKFFDFKLANKGDDKSFCFRSHRVECTDVRESNVHAVNGYAFNKKHGTFYSYGADGSYISWNAVSRAKYRASKQFPSPIVAADQSEDASMFAYSIGYDWSQGAEGMKTVQHSNKLFIRCPPTDEVFRRDIKR